LTAREPARAEVDRVEGEQVGGHLLLRALEEVADRVQRRAALRDLELQGVERLGVDPHAAGRGRDLGAVRADLVGKRAGGHGGQG
jgi:hypothetical protein